MLIEVKDRNRSRIRIGYFTRDDSDVSLGNIDQLNIDVRRLK